MAIAAAGDVDPSGPRDAAGPVVALVGATVFDGTRRHAHCAVLLQGAAIAGIVPDDALPPGCAVARLAGGVLAPGFIDAQVNGGGGALFNDAPEHATLATIAAAHRRYGVTGLLPTLITASPQITAQAIAAASAAVGGAIPGILGLHLEGPHLWPARHGAHRAALMRPLDDADVEHLVAARAAVRVLLVTLAVEQATPARIRRLVDAGVVVSLGHSDASCDAARQAFAAGARGVTHLFNAMSPLRHREPGLVGAALEAGTAWCGIIADGLHVHPSALCTALRAKRGPGRLFLVTDAMSTVGSDATRFVLDGRVVTRTDGRLTLADGTLAGSDLDMAAAVRYAAGELEQGADEALRMASLYPATLLGIDTLRGRIAPGMAADLVHLDDSLAVRATWIAGRHEETC